MPPSTKEILAYRALNRDVDENWVEWAVSMLEQGYDTPHLRILAGESPPFNQFASIELADSTFRELGLDWSDTENSARKYAAELLEDMLEGRRSSQSVLNVLTDICIELDHAKFLFGFYLLQNAKEDLRDSDFQFYWQGADRSNIDDVIFDYARKWIEGSEDYPQRQFRK